MTDMVETKTTPTPDPTILTTEALQREVTALEGRDNRISEESRRGVKLLQREVESEQGVREREHSSLQELMETRLAKDEELSVERVASIRREININEAHRLELKSDSEKTLNTATIAAEKAVQAALAAAEKARDQQTIASQLATTKAEEASKEQMKQQGETFTTAISGLLVGLNDVKGAVGELRAERRGSAEQVVVTRDSAADMKPLTDAVASLVASQQQMLGQRAQVTESRNGSSLLVSVIGAFLVALSLGVTIAAMLLR